MVRNNKREFNDLIALNKVGFGKTSYVDYSFIIDKDYNARIEMCMKNENHADKTVSDKAKLSEDEIIIVDTFIDNFIKPKKEKVALFSDEYEQYEFEQLLYEDMIIEDQDLNGRFRKVTDYLQSEHEEISADNVVKMYNMMSGEMTGRKK